MVALAVTGSGGADAAGPAGPGPKTDPPAGKRHAAAAPAAGSPWQLLVHQPQFNPGAMDLMTNGTVLVHSDANNLGGSPQWWKLTPNAQGSYVKGTWSKVASMASKYGPLYFASAVLPDGRFIIEGGEYNLNKDVWTNKGAIYDPVANKWTPMSPPKGADWGRIGDVPSTVLANGTFMLAAGGYSGIKDQALLNAKNLTWLPTGKGKYDGNDEEGWSLLPNGKVLTVDTQHVGYSEIYTPSTGKWTSAGTTAVRLPDSEAEIGPQILRPNGTVFAAGGSGLNAVYNTATGTWSATRAFPLVGKKQLDAADAPAAVLPDGDVLTVASPGEYTPPSRVFDFNGTKLTQVPNPPNANNYSSDLVYMMVLPTGQVLYNDRYGDFEVYNPTGSPNPSWLPVITSVPTTLSAGGTYKVSGKQLNGLTQGSAYGDDYQSATNFPLVRLTNDATKNVFYARTHGMTSMSVTPGASSSASFTLPAGIPAGAYTLVVVANGLRSKGVAVTVAAG